VFDIRYKRPVKEFKDEFAVMSVAATDDFFQIYSGGLDEVVKVCSIYLVLLLLLFFFDPVLVVPFLSFFAHVVVFSLSFSFVLCFFSFLLSSAGISVLASFPTHCNNTPAQSQVSSFCVSSFDFFLPCSTSFPVLVFVLSSFSSFQVSK
jgi:hypothetical protein